MSILAGGSLAEAKVKVKAKEIIMGSRSVIDA